MPDKPTQEKTEKATPKRLRDARKKGQVFKSQDVTSTAVLAAVFLALAISWYYYLPWLEQFVVLPSLFYGLPFHDALAALSIATTNVIIWMSFPVVLVAAFTAIFACFFQVGPVFSAEPLKPNLSKLNPVEGAKKIFSLKNVIEFIKSLVKVSFLSILVWLVIYHSINSLVKLPYAGPGGILEVLQDILRTLAIVTIIAYIFIAFADYFFQRWQYMKDLKMTKEEVKREFKETEGDPIIKSKRRALAKEIAMNQNIEMARKATVLVTNPTDYAVALFYEREKTKLPVVTAKGEGYMARQMIKAAREAGVPIMRNVPLAQALHHQVEMDHYIPSDLIQPVAEVLRYIQRMKEEGGQAL